MAKRSLDKADRSALDMPSDKPSLADIEGMDRDGLLDLWPKLIRSLVPRSMSQSLLRRFLAYEAQVKVSGGMSKAELVEIARLGSEAHRPKAVRLAAGSRFLREWNGVTHVVERREDGYLWNGKVHGSLSAIAKAITGAHWSGPRFFGVKPAKPMPTRLVKQPPAAVAVTRNGLAK